MKISLSVIILLLIACTCDAQVESSSDLYKTLKSKDSRIFDVGFNQCRLDVQAELMSEDLEFYHDQGGVSYTREANLESMKNGLCKNGKNRYFRELVEGSLEVYPMKNGSELYGAIQKGVHRFYDIKNGKKEFESIANFTHFWMLNGGEWKVKRVFSYNHGGRDYLGSSEIFLNDAEIESFVTDNNIPILGIGVINKGELSQVKVFGDINADIKAPYNTIFNVASLTKPVVGLVILKLVENGEWDLDEPLYHHWVDPDIKSDPRHKEITSRHVLSHSTGFKNWRRMESNNKLTINFTPGTQSQYSGEGYEYLRKAVEEKFKTSIDSLAKSLIFEPLKMTDTTFVWGSTDESRFAHGYDTSGNLYKHRKKSTANAADDLLTTISDYGKFLTAFMNEELINTNSYNLMIKNHFQLKDKKYRSLSWEVFELENEELALVHGGADEGVQTLIIMLPQSGKGLLMFTNVDDGQKIYKRLVNTYLGMKGKEILDIEFK